MKRSCANDANRSRHTKLGFSLVELAISLTIIALLTVGAITALRIQSQQVELRETRALLDQATEAIIGFAIANNGALPRADTNNDGRADPNANRGMIPWQDIGLSSGQDGWTRPIHYQISTGFGDPLTLTRQGSFNIRDAANNPAVTQAAVAFVVWSEGADGVDESSSLANNEIRVPGGNAQVDDIVTWTSRFTLIARRVAAGYTLPN